MVISVENSATLDQFVYVPSGADDEQRPSHDPEHDEKGEVGQPSDGHLNVTVDVQLHDVHSFS